MRSLILAAALTLAAAPALAQSIAVPIDQSRRIALPGAAADIAVGNPGVADVTVVDERNLLVTGKGYGVTNVLALDRAGRTLFDRMVVVSAAQEGVVSVYRGAALQQYACDTTCERASPDGAAAAPATTTP
jgi:Flp pilus assembly secretin CpaC